MLVNEIGEGQQGARSRSAPSELETLSSAILLLRERSDAQSKQISSEMGSRCQKSKSLLLPACLIRELASVGDLFVEDHPTCWFSKKNVGERNQCWFCYFSRGHALRSRSVNSIAWFYTVIIVIITQPVGLFCYKAVEIENPTTHRSQRTDVSEGK